MRGWLLNTPPHPVTLQEGSFRQKRSLTGKSEGFNNPITNDFQVLHHKLSKICPRVQYLRLKNKEKIFLQNVTAHVRAWFLGNPVTSLLS